MKIPFVALNKEAKLIKEITKHYKKKSLIRKLYFGGILKFF